MINVRDAVGLQGVQGAAESNVRSTATVGLQPCVNGPDAVGLEPSKGRAEKAQP